MTIQRILVLTLFLIAQYGCKKLHTIRPACTVEDAVLPIDTSHLSTPLSIPTQLIEDKMNKAIKQELVRDEDFTNISKKTGKPDKLKILVSRLGNIDVQWADNVVTYQVPISVLLEKEMVSSRILPSSKALALKTQFSLRLVFETTVDIGENWRLLPQTKFKNFEWLSEVKAMGGLINLKKPIEKRINAQMPDIEHSMDSMINHNVRIDRTVGKIWRNVQKPIVINRNDKVLWLKINPIRFEIGKISTEGPNLIVQSRITATTEMLVGENPVYVIDSVLPPLRKYAKLPNEAYIYLLSEIPYTAVNKLINEKIAGKEFDLEGHKIRIKTAEVWGCGGQMVLHLSVRGAVKGEMYFHGDPQYEPDSQRVVISNFDFELQTEETLLSGAEWLLHSTFKDKILAELSLPLQNKIEDIPKNIVAGVERGKLGQKIDLQIEEWKFRPRRIWIQRDDIATLVTVQAQVKIEMEEL